MAANEVSVNITVEEKAALKALAKLTKGVDKTTQTTEKGFKKMDMALASFAGNLAANAVGAGLRLIGNGITSIVNKGSQFIDAAARQEDAINKLNTSLMISGKLSEETSLSIQNFASELQKSTKYGDELILENAALIQSLGQLDEQGLKKATKAAVDMSAALGIDLASAATLVGKAAAGEVGSFSRYGVVIKKGADNAQTFSNALEALNSKFGGAAAAQVQTFAGATQQASNTFGDLYETLGFVVTKSPVVIAAIRGFSTGIQQLDKIIKDNTPIMRNFAENVLVGALTGAINIAGNSLIFFNNIINGTRNFINFLADGALGGLQGIQEFAAGVIDASIRVKEFLGLNTAGLESMQASMQKQIEATQLARQLNDQEASERIARQEEFAMQMSTITETINASVQQQVESVKASNDEIMKSSIETSNKAALAKLEGIEKQKKIDKDHFLYTKSWNEKTNKEKIEGVRDSLGAVSSLTASGNSELFAIGKAAALATHGINAAKAVSNALSAAPPPFNFALAALVGTAMAVQGAKIASQKPPAYAEGGFIGGMNGASFGADNSIATVRTGEMVLNANDQRELLTGLKSGAFSGDDAKMDRLISAISTQPVVVQVDGIEIARAVRDSREGGFSV
jgi:hypothetical protein